MDLLGNEVIPARGLNFIQIGESSLKIRKLMLEDPQNWEVKLSPAIHPTIPVFDANIMGPIPNLTPYAPLQIKLANDGGRLRLEVLLLWSYFTDTNTRGSTKVDHIIPI